MGLRSSKKIQVDEEEMQAMEEMKRANDIAKEAFETPTLSPEQLYTVYDIIFSYDDEPEQRRAADNLNKSVGLAKEHFGTSKPTTEMVFGMYDRVFEGGDDEEEDDE